MTGESLKTMDETALRQLWQKAVEVHEQEEDFFSELEGSRSDSLIETVNDTAAQAGSRITFTAMGGFYKDGKHGSTNFETADDFDKVKISSKTLIVDWIRNGVRWDQRMEGYMGLQREVSSQFPAEMGKWLGRKKNRAMWMMFREKGLSKNRIIANGRANVNALVSGDTLSWEDVVDAATVLKNRGAPAAYMGKVGKNPIKRYFIGASTTALRSLKTDDQYLSALESAGPDSQSNILFTGGFADIDGNVIREFCDLDHGGDGAIGSPITPRIRIKDAITAGTAAFDITGGTGDTGTHYTQDFPNYNFKFNASDILTAGSDPFYIAIVNPSDAETDPGKIGFYRATVNNGNKITIDQRLGSTGGGTRHPTVGSVSWNTGVWADKHTDVHPAGAMAYLCNEKGQTYGWTLLGGAKMARRGYGEFRNHRATDDDEGKFIQETYIWTVFGQIPVHREDGEYPNYVMLVHAVQYPGVPFPTIT